MTPSRNLSVLGLLLASVLLAVPALAQSDGATVSPIADAPAPAVLELAAANQVPVAGDAAAGQTKAAVCGACHGMDGNSTDPQYPKLAGQHERYIARHLALFKSGERTNPIMSGFAAMLGAQDARDLGAWFASQKALPGVADDTPIASGPNSGKKFYQVGENLYRGGDAKRGIPACSSCHGPTGSGNPGSAYPSLAGQHSRYTADLLRRYRDGTSYGSGENANAVMKGVATLLTDEEIDSLASYVEGLHAASAESTAAR
jgi:cytochrome c553